MLKWRFVRELCSTVKNSAKQLDIQVTEVNKYSPIADSWACACPDVNGAYLRKRPGSCCAICNFSRWIVYMHIVGLTPTIKTINNRTLLRTYMKALMTAKMLHTTTELMQ